MLAQALLKGSEGSSSISTTQTKGPTATTITAMNISTTQAQGPTATTITAMNQRIIGLEARLESRLGDVESMFSRIPASVDGAGGAVNKTTDIVNKRPDKKTASEATGGVETVA